MNKILVTPRSLTRDGHWAIKKLQQAGFEVIYSTAGVQPCEEELLKLLPDCIGILAGVEPLSEKVLTAAKNLKVISRNGVGINSIDLDACEKLNIKVLTTPGANARSVAELTFGLILSVIRSIAYCDNSLKNQTWQRKKGIELRDRTLGLIGCGNIGKTVTMFALAFDMKVIAFDPFEDESLKLYQNFKYCKLNELISQSDIISLHCPPGPDGKALIDEQAISKMKDGVCLINTARAKLFDDNAVLDGLNCGKIASVGLDVFSPEPPQRL